MKILIYFIFFEKFSQINHKIFIILSNQPSFQKKFLKKLKILEISDFLNLLKTAI